MLFLSICAGIIPVALFFVVRPFGYQISRNAHVLRQNMLPTTFSQRNSRAFSLEYLQDIANRITKCMEEEKPYLHPQLNLVRFSVLTGLPSHHLSRYFRVEMGMSFTDYRNSWRVRHAQSLIREGYGEIMTLEAIGTQSGFASRNAFLVAFKKYEGISPREYMVKSCPARKTDSQSQQEPV